MDLPFVLWRHDVDFSIHEALNLARIEQAQNLRSTYFLLLHSEFYNLFEKSISDIIKEIMRLGHHIALHFDPSFYNLTDEGVLEEKLRFESGIIEQIFGVKVTVFSFHNPTKEIMEFDKWSYAGLINTYSDELKKNVTYCSDSNGYWRFLSLQDLINIQNPEKLQVLTHPEWWTEKVLSPKDKVWRCLDKRAEKNKQHYIDNLAFFGRSIIDWDE
ncbi:MAG: hypothetical protein WCO44_04320 [Bacteroidota bacterium]